MGERDRPKTPVAGHQPPLLAQGDPQQDGGLPACDSPDLNLIQNLQTLLFFAGQGHLGIHGVTLLLTSYRVTDLKNNNNPATQT